MYAYDEKNKRVVVAKVKGLLKNWTGTLIKFTVVGDKGPEIIWATRNHPIFVANALGDVGQYLQATTLQPGMTILDKELKPRVIENVECMATNEDTYNIEIEGYHTFFVGEVGVLVHNASFGDPTTYNFDIYRIGRFQLVRSYMWAGPCRGLMCGLRSTSTRYMDHIQNGETVATCRSR